MRRSLALVTVAWIFGSVWVTTTAGAPLTLFAQALHLSRFEFGVLTALPFIASLLTLPASLLIERTGERKRIFLWGLYAQRLLWFPIALVPMWLLSHYGAKAQGLAVGAFLALVFLMHAGQAVGGPAWMAWMADMVPERLRGRYFSRRRQWGIVSALPAALLVGWVIDRYALPSDGDFGVLRVCGLLFMTAAVFGIADIALFHFVPAVPKAPKRGAHLFSALARPLRDRRFLWFAGFVATLVFAVSFMGTFVTLYVIEEANVNGKGTQLMLIVAPLAAQLLVLPLWGHACDRMGKKPVLKLSTLAFAPVALGWCFLHAGNVWLGYVLSAVGAALWAGVEIANFNFVMEMAGGGDADDANDNRGTSYVAVNAVIVNIAGCLGGLCSGAIAELLRHSTWQPVPSVRPLTYYDVLFILSFVLRVLAVVVFLPHLHEPSAKRGREALRFITINVYSNLYNLVLQPVRLVRGREK